MQDKESKTPYSWGETMGARVCLKAREYGLFIRPVGDVVVFMPPLVSTEEELLEMLSLLRQAVIAVTEQGAVVEGGGGAHF
jgi:adenosylmethionine-8-amino-7-oxononanoate aminotransferase